MEVLKRNVSSWLKDHNIKAFYNVVQVTKAVFRFRKNKHFNNLELGF